MLKGIRDEGEVTRKFMEARCDRGAEIARMLGVHESTISRKLDKLAKAMRKQILAALGRRGMSRRQAEEALEIDVRDVQLDIRRRLAQEALPAAFSEKRVEARVREGEG